MFQTRTGGYGIGFRRGWSDWQKDLEQVIAFARENGFACLDLGADAAKIAPAVLAAGLRIGSADLLGGKGLITADAAKRKDAVAANREYIEACAAHGIRNFFCVMIPEKPELGRADNFKLMIAGMQEIAPVLEKHQARLVIEGWPGPGALCCNPETCRMLFKEVPSSGMGINYDPSHMLRMGIDPIRFLLEFVERVHHVHGKDCELISEALYEVGHEQAPVFTKGHGFGSAVWRYTIPGHGQMRWVEALNILKSSGYDGLISIELEDENFNGSKEGEQTGLLAGARFLAAC